MTLNIIVGMQHFKSDDPTVITQADSTHFHLDYERLAVQIILALLTTLSLLFVLRRPRAERLP